MLNFLISKSKLVTMMVLIVMIVFIIIMILIIMMVLITEMVLIIMMVMMMMINNRATEDILQYLHLFNAIRFPTNTNGYVTELTII